MVRKEGGLTEKWDEWGGGDPFDGLAETNLIDGIETYKNYPTDLLRIIKYHIEKNKADIDKYIDYGPEDSIKIRARDYINNVIKENPDKLIDIKKYIDSI